MQVCTFQGKRQTPIFNQQRPHLLVLHLLALGLLPVLFTGCSAPTEEIRTDEVPAVTYRPTSFKDFEDTYFVRHKLEEILHECGETEFLDDDLLAEYVVRFVRSYSEPRTVKHTNMAIVRGGLYFDYVRDAFADLEICKHVAWGLPFVESRFKPDAKSHANARGMFQFIPSTAREFGLEDPYDWREASQVSAVYIATLRKVFGESIVLALAAYNGGQQRVFNAIYRSSKLYPHTKGFLFSDIYSHLPLETKEYPGRVLAAALVREFLREMDLELLPEEYVE